MPYYILKNITVCFFMILLLFGCKKHKSDVERLPAITTTGEETFGCLINGKIFLPRKKGTNVRLSSYYQHIYPGTNGWAFGIRANRFAPNSCEIMSVHIVSDSIRLEEGGRYSLNAVKRGNFSGEYFHHTNCLVLDNPIYTEESAGELIINRLDTINLIVSGTFYFDVTDRDGKTLHITDGRFDVHFTL